MDIATVEFYKQFYEVGATISLNVQMKKQTGQHKWS